jgi:hypothetical protein
MMQHTITYEFLHIQSIQWQEYMKILVFSDKYLTTRITSLQKYILRVLCYN